MNVPSKLPTKFPTKVDPKTPSTESTDDPSVPLQWVLLACSLRGEGALALLGGLSESRREASVPLAREILRWDSAKRRARVALEFGPHPEAAARVAGLAQSVSPALVAAAAQGMPGYVRADLERGRAFGSAGARGAQGGRSIPSGALLSRLVERLAKERVFATRVSPRRPPSRETEGRPGGQRALSG